MGKINGLRLGGSTEASTPTVLAIYFGVGNCNNIFYEFDYGQLPSVTMLECVTLNLNSRILNALENGIKNIITIGATSNISSEKLSFTMQQKNRCNVMHLLKIILINFSFCHLLKLL